LLTRSVYRERGRSLCRSPKGGNHGLRTQGLSLRRREHRGSRKAVLQREVRRPRDVRSERTALHLRAPRLRGGLNRAVARPLFFRRGYVPGSAGSTGPRWR
jgi:hypothetical protein